MNSSEKKMLILLGGMWHDFEGFTAAMRLAFKGDFRVTATYDLEELTRLDEIKPDIVLSYTGLSLHREGHDDQGPEALTIDQIHSLASWVRSGGKLLGVHCATVAGASHRSFRDLFSGVFISHPAPFYFTVFPLTCQHPITNGIEAFNVLDEFYIQDIDPTVDIHMVAVDRMQAYPMVWSKTEGLGRMAYIAMGHYPDIWTTPAYRQLLRNTAAWLLSP
jgi:type 1 glutamine amidotransferase